MEITAAGNTEVPAYLVLITKGYDVSHIGGVDGDLWLARKDNDSFTADGPLLLLGLVAMAEGRGTDWRATDQENRRLLGEISWNVAGQQCGDAKF